MKLITVDIETTFTIESYVLLQEEALRVAESSLKELRAHVLELATNVCKVSQSPCVRARYYHLQSHNIRLKIISDLKWCYF